MIAKGNLLCQQHDQLMSQCPQGLSAQAPAPGQLVRAASLSKGMRTHRCHPRIPLPQQAPSLSHLFCTSSDPSHSQTSLLEGGLTTTWETQKFLLHVSSSLRE